MFCTDAFQSDTSDYRKLVSSVKFNYDYWADKCLGEFILDIYAFCQCSGEFISLIDRYSDKLFTVQTGAQVILFHCQKGVYVSLFHRQKCLFYCQKYF